MTFHEADQTSVHIPDLLEELTNPASQQTQRDPRAPSNLTVLTTSWTVLCPDEAPVRRVLDQDHQCPPGASSACPPVLD